MCSYKWKDTKQHNNSICRTVEWNGSTERPKHSDMSIEIERRRINILMSVNRVSKGTDYCLGQFEYICWFEDIRECCRFFMSYLWNIQNLFEPPINGERKLVCCKFPILREIGDRTVFQKIFKMNTIDTYNHKKYYIVQNKTFLNPKL